MGSPPTPKKRPGRRGRFLTPSLAPRARARSKRRGATWTPTRSRWSTTRRGASESNLVLSCGATRLVTSGYVSFDFAPSATGIVGRDPAKIEMVIQKAAAFFFMQACPTMSRRSLSVSTGLLPPNSEVLRGLRQLPPCLQGVEPLGKLVHPTTRPLTASLNPARRCALVHVDDVDVQV